MPRPAPPTPPPNDKIKLHLIYLRQHLNYVTETTIIPSKNMPEKLFIRVHELNQRVEKSDHIDLCVRIDDLLNLSDDKYIDYYTEQLDCFDPFGNQESIIISQILLDILHYEHWNQYYYKNMSDEDLLNLINKGIKQYKIDKKKQDLENDLKEYKETCKDAGLTLILSSSHPTTAAYKDYIICRFVKMTGEPFAVAPPDNQQGLSFFPIGEYSQRLCPLSGVPMKNKIYKAIQFVKEYAIQQKKKEIEKDFEV